MTIETPGSQDRFYALDGMRGIAAIGVMLGHFLVQEFHIFGHSFAPFGQSALAVDLFFVLSGFVLSHAYAEKLQHGMTYRELFAKRFIRLYPLFATGLALGTLTLVLIMRQGMSDLTLRTAALDTLFNLSFIPAFSHETMHDFGWALAAPIFPANPPSWSLFFEMVASMALPWLLTRKTRVLAILAAFSGLAFLAYGIHAGLAQAKSGFNPAIGWNVALFIGGFFRVGYGFILGIILYRHRPQIGAWLERYLPVAFRHPVFLYAATFAMLLDPLSGRGLVALFNLMVAIPLLVAVGSVSTLRQRPVQRLSHWLGYLSYPLYCLHFPVGRIVSVLTQGTHLSAIAFAALAGTVSIAVALTVGRLIDEPMRRLLGRWLQPVEAPPLAPQPAGR